jgi:hypothetical protein
MPSASWPLIRTACTPRPAGTCWTASRPCPIPGTRAGYGTRWRRSWRCARRRRCAGARHCKTSLPGRLPRRRRYWPRPAAAAARWDLRAAAPGHHRAGLHPAGRAGPGGSRGSLPGPPRRGRPVTLPVAGPGWLPGIAVDGKPVRGAAGPDGLIPYLLAAATHDTCAVIAERHIRATCSPSSASNPGEGWRTHWPAPTPSWPWADLKRREAPRRRTARTDLRAPTRSAQMRRRSGRTFRQLVGFAFR